MHKLAVSLDIDGVINDYPKCWLRYIESITGYRFASKLEAKRIMGEKYRQVKNKYRNSNAKENVKVKSDIKYVIQKLYNKTEKFYFHTTRPIKNEKYPNLEAITKRWLKKNNIQYDKLRKKDRLLRENEVDVHIDDNIEHAKKIRRYNTRVILYGQCKSFEQVDGDIHIAHEPADIYNKVKQLA
jgi:uncharacterized HAD superfamily protein